MLYHVLLCYIMLSTYIEIYKYTIMYPNLYVQYIIIYIYTCFLLSWEFGHGTFSRFAAGPSQHLGSDRPARSATKLARDN